MSTRQILRVLRELSSIGCLRVSFSGGEPTLRDDIGWLVDGCAALGMVPEMNSSGHGVADRIGELGGLRLLKLSLDGPEEIHDEVRGRKGSYVEVMEALRAARGAGIRTVLVTTITSRNVGQLDHVLELARDAGVFAAFQPIKPYYKGAVDIEDLLPDPGDMRRAVEGLVAARRDGYAHTLRNSPAGLEHLSDWPRYGELRCWAGRIFCIVGADGTLYPCDRTRIDDPLPSCTEEGLEKALERLPDPDCEGCGFCGALELNFAMALDWRVARTILKLVR